MLKNLSLKNKILIFSIVTSGAFTFFAGFAFYALKTNGALFAETEQVYMPVHDELDLNQERLRKIVTLLQQAERDHDQTLIDRAATEVEAFRESLLSIVGIRPVQRDQIYRIRNILDDYFNSATRLIFSADSQNKQIMEQQLKTLQDSMLEYYDNLQSSYNNAVTSAGKISDGVLFLSILLTMVFLTTNLLFYILLKNTLLNPIHQLIDTTKKISKGDLDQSITIHSSDEIAELADAFNTMANSLKSSYGELQISNTKLIAATEAKSAFLANMSHEMRTPLTAIIGYSEELLNGNINRSEHPATLSTILHNGIHLKRVIDDILDVSRIETNQLVVNRKKTPLFTFIQNIVDNVEPCANEKHLDFVANYHYPLPEYIDTDCDKLQQIVDKLTSNSIKFTRQGKIQIDFSYTPTDNKFTIAVTDTGIGIPKQQLDTIFDLFEQGDAGHSRRFGGSGLGLPISRHLAQLLNGTIHVKSPAGNGSTFSVIVDAGKETGRILQKSDAQVTDSTRDIGRSATNRRGVVPLHSISSPTTVRENTANEKTVRGNILLAEDVVINQNLIKLYLSKAGVRVTTVENGSDAVRYALQNDYDLILMDIQMPDMNGMEATRHLLEQDYRTPILAITANALQRDFTEYEKAGFHDVIPKPFTKKELLVKLSSYLPKLNEWMQENDFSIADTTPDDYTEVPAQQHLARGESVANVVQQTNNSVAEETDAVIISSLIIDDEDMLDLLHDYIADLSVNTHVINRDLENKDWKNLKYRLHKIKGTAGGFGFPQLTDIAKEINLLIDNKDYQSVQQKMHTFNDICHRIVRGGENQKTAVGSA